MTADPFAGARLAALRTEFAGAALSSLTRLTDRATYSRAMEYADNGNVVEFVHLKGTVQLRGRVLGSRDKTYTSVARFEQAPSGTIATLSGVCTCPVVSNCKHVFALVITAFREAAEAAGPRVSSPVGSSAPWQHSIAALLRDDRRPHHDEGRQLGLQVELTRIRPSIGGGWVEGESPPIRVALRPVQRGAKGKWVRTGIGWDQLSAYHHRQQPPRAEHLQLLREISAVADTQSARSYGYHQTHVYLEGLGGGAVWDLLAQARDIGLAIVQAGRDQCPVQVSTGLAEIGLDISRDEHQLVVAPAIAVDGTEIDSVDFVLLGEPLQGLALWPAGPDFNNSGLTLVRSKQRVSAELRAMVGGGGIEIPASDAEVFSSGFLPGLARRVPLTSRDGSIEIPHTEPPMLTLTVTGLSGHRAAVHWEWLYRTGQTAIMLPLFPADSDQLPRDREAESAALKVVSASIAGNDQLLVPGHFEPRLLPAATIAGAHAIGFFTQTLPRLRLLPELTVTVLNEPVYRESTEAPVISISNTQNPKNRDWFDLAITVTIEDEEVPFNDLFLALAAADNRLILPSGTYFSLEGEQFRTLRRLIEEARALEDVPSRTVTINRYQASLWQELQALAVIKAQSATWKKTVQGLLSVDQVVDRPRPASLQAVLRPYQQAGFKWLAFLYDHGLGGVLADDMGLGKTVQTLALICHARASAPAAAPFLVVAPTSVVGNWAAECRRFAPDLRVVVLTETITRSGIQLSEELRDADLVLTSYALFRLDYDEYCAQHWSGLILDEAQFIKNHLSKGYQCAKKLPAPFKLAITGTPMENNLLELWSMFSVTAPGLFSTSARFKEYYQGPIEKNANSDRLAQLRRRIAPLMLRRTKGQVAADLPAKQEQIIELELNPRHRKVYETHLQRERQKVLGLIDDLQKNRFMIFRSLTLLRQLSLDAGLVDTKYANIPSTKLDALMEQVRDIVAEGHRTLIFSQFTGFLALVRNRMDAAGVGYCYLDGKTRNRPGVLAEFKSGDAPVFLISLKAGGVGLNLTEADYCILLDPWWNPATEAQAVDRIHRIGQTRKVMVYRMVAKDTIEEKVMALKAGKAKLFSSVMGTGSAQSGALSAADIRELLS
ncbi:MAG: DEAD/DEAH box helicase [Nakamurella sp.]